MTRQDEAMLYAIERGMFIDREGKVTGLKGKPITGSILKRSKNQDGSGLPTYYYAGTKVGKVMFHRLQAYTKYGDSLFDPTLEVRHLDGNSHNNSWDNISLGTHAKNMKDMYKHIAEGTTVRAVNSNRAISFEQAERIRELRKEGWTYGELGKLYSVTRWVIRDAVLKRCYIR